MSDQRIEIIVKEINYWKENKLLPVVYCDFLLALYTRGEEATVPAVIEDEDFKKQSDKIEFKNLIQFFLQLLTLLFALILIYTLPTDIIIHSILLITLLLVSFGVCFFQKESDNLMAQLSIFILLLLLFIISLFFMRYFQMNYWVLNAFVVGQFIMWFYISRKKKLKYLTVISIVAFFYKTFIVFIQLIQS